jgi:hypothetical protein
MLKMCARRPTRIDEGSVTAGRQDRIEPATRSADMVRTSRPLAAASGQPRSVVARFELQGENLDLLGVIRRAVEDTAYRLGATQEIVDEMVVACHELAENALEYSSDGHAALFAELLRDGGTLRARIGASNLAAPRDIPVLVELAKEMSEVTDRATFYQARLQQAARAQEGSGLGLARILGETELALTISVIDGRVLVEAACEQPLEGGQP